MSEKNMVDHRPDLEPLQQRAAADRKAARRHSLLVALGFVAGVGLVLWLGSMLFK